MAETDKELIFSESVKAGKRIYYFDIKQSRNGDRYIAITESKKINEGTAENPRFVFEKHKIFLYKEDYEKFMDALNLTLAKAKEMDGAVDGGAPAPMMGLRQGLLLRRRHLLRKQTRRLNRRRRASWTR